MHACLLACVRANFACCRAARREGTEGWRGRGERQQRCCGAELVQDNKQLLHLLLLQAGPTSCRHSTPALSLSRHSGLQASSGRAGAEGTRAGWDTAGGVLPSRTCPYLFCSSATAIWKPSGAASNVALQNSGYACSAAPAPMHMSQRQACSAALRPLPESVARLWCLWAMQSEYGPSISGRHWRLKGSTAVAQLARTTWPPAEQPTPSCSAALLQHGSDMCCSSGTPAHLHVCAHAALWGCKPGEEAHDG
jgi:hypothetical protein